VALFFYPYPSRPYPRARTCARFARAQARTSRPYLRPRFARARPKKMGGATELPKLRDTVTPLCYVDARQFTT